MQKYTKITLTLFIGLITCFTWRTVAQVETEPRPVTIAETPVVNYVFETVDVPGVDFLEVAASNDLGHYAGNTRSPNGEKTIGFTLIDGVFATYDFPGSRNTFFYGLDNAGKAVGYYEDVNELYHGLIVQNGELTQYDFPGATQTLIFGISDETGALSGNIIDEKGIIRGFSGDSPIEFPGAVTTYADFVNAAGVVVGSYVDTEGRPHGFMLNPDGSFNSIDLPKMLNLEFLFVNAINDAGVIVFRAKAVDDIPRSYIIPPGGEPHELRLPGSVSTVVRNINQDGSIIGYYDLTDMRRHGFIARPATPKGAKDFSNVYFTSLSKGLNMLSVPLKSPTPMTARSLAAITGATTVIALDCRDPAFRCLDTKLPKPRILNWRRKGVHRQRSTASRGAFRRRILGESNSSSLSTACCHTFTKRAS